MTYQNRSVFDENFLSTIKQWFDNSHDCLVVVRYAYTAGGKEFFWLRNFETFRSLINEFPPQTDVIVFRDEQFTLRGEVNDEFIREALDLIPDKTECMVTEGLEPPDTSINIWQPDTHADLSEILGGLFHKSVALGRYAAWHEADNEAMISALVPLPNGTLKRGAY